MKTFPITNKTKLSRSPKRGAYDQDTIYRILDEALFCTLAFSKDDHPFQIPTGFCRVDDKIYVHGSVGSPYLRDIVARKLSVCIGVTLLDGIVLSRSAFDHSVNYRSVIMFGQPELITDEATLYKVMEVFTNKMCPQRWDDVRKPNAGEWKATVVLGFSIEEVSSKIRNGPPVDNADDYSSKVWAGVQPIKMVRMPVVPDPLLDSDIPLPGYLV